MLNPKGASKVRIEWQGADKMRTRMVRHVLGGFMGLRQLGLPDAIYNLPLLLAVEVLKKTLQRAKAQYGFESDSWSFADLMAGSRAVLTYENYSALWAAMQRRNAIAHNGELFPAQVCLEDIANIEKQLYAWQLVSKVRDPEKYDAIDD
jgi:hypothetical protein